MRKWTTKIATSAAASQKWTSVQCERSHPKRLAFELHLEALAKLISETFGSGQQHPADNSPGVHHARKADQRHKIHNDGE
jgi:hypothetical protein